MHVITLSHQRFPCNDFTNRTAPEKEMSCHCLIESFWKHTALLPEYISCPYTWTVVTLHSFWWCLCVFHQMRQSVVVKKSNSRITPHQCDHVHARKREGNAIHGEAKLTLHSLLSWLHVLDVNMDSTIPDHVLQIESWACTLKLLLNQIHRSNCAHPWWKQVILKPFVLVPCRFFFWNNVSLVTEKNQQE